MQNLVATLRGAVHQQQRAAAYAALLPSLVAALQLAPPHQREKFFTPEIFGKAYRDHTYNADWHALQ